MSRRVALAPPVRATHGDWTRPGQLERHRGTGKASGTRRAAKCRCTRENNSGGWHWCGRAGGTGAGGRVALVRIREAPCRFGWHWLRQCGRLPRAVPVPGRSCVTVALAKPVAPDEEQGADGPVRAIRAGGMLLKRGRHALTGRRSGSGAGRGEHAGRGPTVPQRPRRPHAHPPRPLRSRAVRAWHPARASGGWPGRLLPMNPRLGWLGQEGGVSRPDAPEPATPDRSSPRSHADTSGASAASR